MSPSRRGLLTTIAAMGLAGCNARSITPTRLTDETTTPPPTTDAAPTTATTTDATTTEEPAPDPNTGETIPPVSHPGTRPVPATAGPMPGVDNPVLTAADVTDFGDVTFVADPFLFVEDDQWHLFFEVYNENREDPDAVIGYAHSPDGTEWTYDGVVLSKDIHTSFPLIWKWEDDYYMCPPTMKDVELWKARSFPHDWEFIGNAVDVDYFPHDPVFLRHDERWWIVADRGYEDVMVYYSDDLEASEWTPHPENPVVTGRAEASRPGGRPVVVDGTPYLFFQDLSHEYGDKIRAYEVLDLTTSTYRDREVPESPAVAESGTGWNAGAMHTFDPWWVGDGWACAVDGKVDDEWSIGLFHVPADLGVDPSYIPYDRAYTEGYYRVGAQSHVVADHSGDSCHGTVYGGTREARDGIDGLRFEDEGRIVVSHPHRSPLGSDAFSLVTYAQPATDDHGTLLDYGHPDGDRHLRVGRGGAGQWHVSARGGDGRTAFDARAPPATGPTQVALRYRAADGLGLFVDGALRGTGAPTGDVTDPLSYLVAGADRPGDAPWTGWVGPVGVFSVALSEGELSSIDDRVRE